MKLSELPTRLIMELSQRCRGLNATLRDSRVILAAVVTACEKEVDDRIGGKDFPELDKETIAQLAAALRCSNEDFIQLLWELEE